MPALRITAEDFERMFQLPAGSLPSRLKSQLQALNTSFHWANEQETREYLDMFESRIAAPVNQRTSAETLAAFEKGWGGEFPAAAGKRDFCGGSEARLFSRQQISPLFRENSGD